MPVAVEKKIRRFSTTAALLAWTPTHDGQRARANDTEPPTTYTYYADQGWIRETDADAVETLFQQIASSVTMPSTWFVRVGGPLPGDGNDGDLALDPATGDVYFKNGGVWGIITNIRGPAGAAGADGTPGSIWFAGTGAPSSGLGISGDFYLDNANGDVYEKLGGTWTLQGNIRGPTGATGPAGTPATYAFVFASVGEFAAPTVASL